MYYCSIPKTLQSSSEIYVCELHVHCSISLHRHTYPKNDDYSWWCVHFKSRTLLGHARIHTGMSKPSKPLTKYFIYSLVRVIKKVKHFLLDKILPMKIYLQSIFCSTTCCSEAWNSSCHPDTSDQKQSGQACKFHYLLSFNPNPAIPLRREGSRKHPSCKFAVSSPIAATSDTPPWSLMRNAGSQLSSADIKSSSYFFRSSQIFSPSSSHPFILNVTYLYF